MAHNLLRFSSMGFKCLVYGIYSTFQVHDFLLEAALCVASNKKSDSIKAQSAVSVWT